MDNAINTTVIEALILSSPEPLPGRKVIEVLSDLTPSKVGQVVAGLNNRYMESGSSFRIREIAGGYQFYVIPEFAGYVQELFTRRRKMRLTRAALETLSITAYRQPVTKAEIEHIRGVASDGVIHNLLQKGLLTIKGRADTVGKPLQYGTTNEFLKFFGLASLADLPKMSEIEELLRSKESQDQTELPLAVPEELGQTAQKLNIADGIYVPPSEYEESSSSEMEPEAETAAVLDEKNEFSAIADDEPVSHSSGIDDETSLTDGDTLVAEIESEELTPIHPSSQESLADHGVEPVGAIEEDDSEDAVVSTESEGVIVDMDSTGTVE